jgi:8-amino-7-oxononanoate synthase
MPDFTSALYLGLRHPSASLRPWDALTLGRPAGLQEPPGAAAVAADLARLQGCEAGMLLPSTLHLFWDLFQILADDDAVILMDAGIYPIARWGVERAAALGVPVGIFPHLDAAAAERLARSWAQSKRRPVIVADGYSPGRGMAAPVAAYAGIARTCGGYLVLDDTQALGIFGGALRSGAPSAAPYGRAGGGSLQRHGVAGPHLVVGASLAKGFGVPVAVLVASRALVRRFKARSNIHTHTSPPSTAVIRAAQHALEVNRQCGDRLRLHLWRLVRRLRTNLDRIGLAATGGVFPVQTLEPAAGLDAVQLHERLRRQGVETVLQRGRNGCEARVSFLLTANHMPQDIDRAMEALAQILSAQGNAKSHLKHKALEAS